MNDHIESNDMIRWRYAKYSLPKKQMRGRRDGNEFGQSLDDAKEEGLEEGHKMIEGCEIEIGRMVNGGWLMADG